MVRALRKRVWRTLRESPGRYIGVSCLILLGSFYFTAASGISHRLETMVSGFSEGSMQEDLTFSVDRSLAGIEDLERESGALIEATKHVDLRANGGEVRLFSPNAKVNIPAILEGRSLRFPGDILLDPNALRRLGIRIGERIALEGRDFTVVGTMALPSYIYITKNLYDVLPSIDFGIGIVSLADLEAFPRAETSYAARFKQRENQDAQAIRLHSLLVGEGYALSEWLEAKRNKRVSMPWANISSMKSMSLPVAMCFYLLSCLIVSAILKRIVKSDFVVIGTLYAQGCRRGELLRHYLSIPLLLSAIGASAGALLALPFVDLVVDFMLSTYILPHAPAPLSLPSFLLGVSLPVATVGAACYLALRASLRKSAVSLLKGDEDRAKVNALERALRLEHLGFNAKFKICEQVRSIPRLLFLSLGVSAASMILLYGLTYGNSMRTMMEKGALERYRYPLEYIFKEARIEADEALPEGAEPYNALRAYPEGRPSVEFYLVGMKTDSVGFRVDDEFGAALPRDQVNISAPLAERLGLSTGDMITVVDKLDGRSYRLRLGGIVQAYGEQFIYMPLDEFNRMSGQSPGSYRAVLSERELDVDTSLLSGVMDTRDREAYKELARPTTLIMNSVTVLSLFIALIIIHLVGSQAIEESRASVALLRVFGYSSKEVARLVLGGATPIVLLGFCLSLPMMLAFGNGISSFVAEALNMLLPMLVNPVHVLVSLAAIMAVYGVTSALIGKRLSAIPMSEALKSGGE